MLTVDVNAMLNALFQDSICLHSLTYLYFVFIVSATWRPIDNFFVSDHRVF